MAFKVRWKSRLGSSPGASIARLVDIADRAMIAAVPRISRIWLKEAKMLAPRGDTGNLRKYLKIKPIKGSTRVTLEYVWYTLIVNSRKEFLRTALFNVKSQALRIIRQEFLKRI